MLEHHAKNLYINVTALFTTLGLSIMELLNFLDGVLPTVSLLLSTTALAVLVYLHLRNAKKINLEIQKLQRDLDASENDL